MTREITNQDDTIDSRDVIERIEELEGEDELSESEAEELATLYVLARQGEGFEDWPYGATLIRESYFAAYAKDYAHDTDQLHRRAEWPYNHIDWEAAAEALKVDYNEIEFGDVTYYIR